MFQALQSCDPGALLKSYQEISVDLDQEYSGDSLKVLTANIIELRKFFKICVERELGLIMDY